MYTISYTICYNNSYSLFKYFYNIIYDIVYYLLHTFLCELHCEEASPDPGSPDVPCMQPAASTLALTSSVVRGILSCQIHIVESLRIGTNTLPGVVAAAVSAQSNTST